MKEIRHWAMKEQIKKINAILRGHYNYYGIGGNFGSLQAVYRTTERYWFRMLSSRSWKGRITWERFQKITKSYPVLRPKLHIPFNKMVQYAML